METFHIICKRAFLAYDEFLFATLIPYLNDNDPVGYALSFSSNLTTQLLEFVSAYSFEIMIVLSILISISAFLYFVSELLFAYILGFILWKLEIMTSWKKINVRFHALEIKIYDFDFGPLPHSIIFAFWKRNLPWDFRYLRASELKIVFDLRNNRTHTSLKNCYACARITHQNEWNSDVQWVRDMAVGYKHRWVHQSETTKQSSLLI